MSEQDAVRYEALVDEAEARETKASDLYYMGHEAEAMRVQESADMCYREAAELAHPATC